MPILYSLRRHPDGFMIAKFDVDFNVAAIYHLKVKETSPLTRALPTNLICECPAGPRLSCKHRKMVPIFVAANAIDSSKFYCYETQTWHQPIPTMTAGDDAATRAAELNAYEAILGKRPNAVYQGTPIYEVESLEGAAPIIPTALELGGAIHACLDECQTHNWCLLNGCKRQAAPNITATEINRRIADPLTPANQALARAHAALLEPLLDKAIELTNAGEGPGPSTHAVEPRASPSQEPGSASPGRRGEPVVPLRRLK